MTALVDTPLRCAVVTGAVACLGPATRALRVEAACGCHTDSYCCDTHPSTALASIVRCDEHGVTLLETRGFRRVHEGDLPDQPGVRIVARYDDGRIVEVPA